MPCREPWRDERPDATRLPKVLFSKMPPTLRVRQRQLSQEVLCETALAAEQADTRTACGGGSGVSREFLDVVLREAIVLHAGRE